ncbi:unnamed protein product [Dicrocoelium dendriticum]|nr:unnamed protein product [Dicrocoelium dendriticum]
MHPASQTVKGKATEAIYMISYHIALTAEPHTVTEEHIKRRAVQMARYIHLSPIPPSNDIVSRRINAFAMAVKNKLTSRIRSVHFALQLY